MSHSIPSESSSTSRVRTGYEKVIASRTGETYACVAQRDGVVEAIDNNLKMVSVRYTSEKIVPNGTMDLGKSDNTLFGEFLQSNFIMTLRAGSEKPIFAPGDIVKVSPTLMLKISDVKRFTDPKELPTAYQPTEKEQHFLKNEKDFYLLTLERLHSDNTKDVDVFQFGVKHTSISGSSIEQNIVLNVEPNQKIKKGDVIAYNSGFFELDEFDDHQVNWKHGVQAMTALIECDTTYEDSNAISRSLSEKLSFTPSHTRELVINNKTTLQSIVDIGDQVQTTDLLCVIEDSDVDALTLTDDPSTVEFLSSLNRKAPKAKYSGIIKDIDVLYSCPLDEIHPSVVALIKKIDARKNKMARFAAHTLKADNFIAPSQLTPGTKYRGIDFENDTVVIFITISEKNDCTTGDKLVCSSQMKSVVADVYDAAIMTESGVNIDMLFSAKSVHNRLVMSPLLTGTLERVLEKMELDIITMYESE